ncbi:MAG: hypothetical protein JEZ02_12310 [Desulfatibacillum sp.]|nr:hypothetical protein [Desulfatibacillum sp.]
MNTMTLFLVFLLLKIIVGLALLLWRFPWLWDILSPALGGPVEDTAA